MRLHVAGLCRPGTESLTSKQWDVIWQAERRNLKDMTLGPVLSWTTDAMMNQVGGLAFSTFSRLESCHALIW